MNKMNKFLLAISLLAISATAFAGPATDAYWAANARYEATCSNGHTVDNSSDCRAAFNSYQAASRAMQVEAWSTVQEHENERMRVQQDEQWRQQVRGR
ncbi:MAG TPA: hypothetical protein VFM18_14060 [Methanosarcina sp.]|nr:hypothetical protein [Methanosarcina sp.]